MRKNRLCGAMILVMLLNIFMPVTLAEENGYIYIQTAADLTELSNNCMIDSYSAGKTVILKNDIDMKNTEFNPIGYFNGVFDGGGYKISSLAFDFSDPERGFIGTVGEGAVIKNLCVSAKIKEKSEKSSDKKLKLVDAITDELNDQTAGGLDRFSDSDGIYSIGGICGINRGTIENCEFEGSIEVSKAAGGIAGVNDQTGKILTSRNRAEIIADKYAGGIAGKNNGVIRWCENFGQINNTPNEQAKNAGGICGFSDGAVMESYNRGIIGYKNTGTNIGGIAGSQSGYMAECVNYGAVYGKHEVGGITGHFEPYININFNEDDIQRRINETADKIRDNINEVQDGVDKNVQTIHDSIMDLRNNLFPSLKSGGGETTGLLDSIKSVTDSLAKLNGTIDSKVSDSDVGSSVSDMARSVSGAVSDTSQSLDKNVSEAVDGLDKTLADMRENSKTSSDNINSLINSSEDAINRLSDNADLLSGNLTDSNERILDVLDTLEMTLNNSDADREELINTLTDAISDLDVNVDVNMDGLDFTATDRQLAQSIKSAFGDAGNSLGSISDDVKSILAPYVRISDALTDIIDKIENRNALINDQKEKLKQALSELLKQLESKPSPTILPIITPKPSTGKLSGALRAALGLLETTAHAEGDDEKTTIQKLADMDIQDMDIEINRKIGDTEYDAALIKYCINSGEVYGVSDAGGIAGSVSFELKISSSKSSVNKEGTISLDPSTAVKAVISTSINEGDIYAKNTSAGGITGYSDLGSIRDCINTGYACVSEGAYAGGISGYNMHNITRCINTGDTDAQSDIGGIAGKGTNINGSYALARTSSTGARQGAIAGSTDGDVKNNYFLKEKLGGINGVDYSKRAEGVTKDIIAKDGEISQQLEGFNDGNYTAQSGGLYMPQLKAFTENNASGIGDILKAMSSDCAQFRFDVEFIKDGETILSMKLDYGQVIDEKDVPKLEKRNGEYGVWDKDTSQEIIRDTKFTAIYSRSKSTLSYGGEPPLLLAEGNFTPDAKLEVREFDAKTVVDGERYTPKSGYDIKINDAGGEYSDELTVRVRDEKGKRTAVGIVENGAVVITECERDGSYVKFMMEKPGEFIVLHEKSRLPLVIGIISALLLLAAAAAYALRDKIKNLLHKTALIRERIGSGTLPALDKAKEEEKENDV